MAPSSAGRSPSSLATASTSLLYAMSSAGAATGARRTAAKDPVMATGAGQAAQRASTAPPSPRSAPEQRRLIGLQDVVGLRPPPYSPRCRRPRRVHGERARRGQLDPTRRAVARHTLARARWQPRSRSRRREAARLRAADQSCRLGPRTVARPRGGGSGFRVAPAALMYRAGSSRLMNALPVRSMKLISSLASSSWVRALNHGATTRIGNLAASERSIRGSPRIAAQRRGGQRTAWPRPQRSRSSRLGHEDR